MHFFIIILLLILKMAPHIGGANEHNFLGHFQKCLTEYF